MSVLLLLFLGCTTTKRTECEAVNRVAMANAGVLDTQNKKSKEAGEGVGARMRLLAAMLRKQEEELAALPITDSELARLLGPMREHNLAKATAADHAAASAEALDADAMQAASAELEALKAKEAAVRDPLDAYCFGG